MELISLNEENRKLARQFILHLHVLNALAIQHTHIALTDGTC